MAKILLMEDEEVQAELLYDIVESLGHDVRHAFSATQAMEMMSETRFDLLITDILVRDSNGPNGDGGILLIGRMRSVARDENQKWLNKMPILAISGVVHHPGLSHILNMAKSVGADMCLAKPLRRAELKAALDELLNSQIKAIR